MRNCPKTRCVLGQYSYNSLNQLTQKSDANGDTKYSYDKRGNRVLDKLQNWMYNQCQSYEYDASGKMIQGNEGNGQDAKHSKYTYNGLGVRVNNTITDELGWVFDRDYVIDYTSYERNDLAVYATTTPDMGKLYDGRLYDQKNIYAGDRRIELTYHQYTDPRETISPVIHFSYYAHEDIMGSTSYYTQQDGSVYDSHVYDVWGSVQWSSGHGVNDGKTAVIEPNYTGHNYDPVLEIYFAEARFYDAKNRQWMASDPVKDGLNWYGYVEGNPTTYFDPDGLELILIQHGVNSDKDGSKPLAEKLEEYDADKYLNAGVISQKDKDSFEKQIIDVQPRLDSKIVDELKKSGNSHLKDIGYSNYTFEQKVDLLDQMGVDVVVATEFSNQWGSHKSQRDELVEIINTALPTPGQKVSLVGHSKGGLVGAYTAAYFAQLDPCEQKINKIISVDTPYNANMLAIVQFMGQSTFNMLTFNGVDMKGIEQLAGIDKESLWSMNKPYNPANEWNDNFGAIQKSNIEYYALYAQYGNTLGDMVVSLDSQKGGNFYGFEESGDKQNVFEIVDSSTTTYTGYYNGQKFTTTYPNQSIDHLDVMHKLETAAMVDKLLRKE